MFESKGRHVFAGLAVAMAITGCTPDERSAGARLEEGPPAQYEQSISVITGYDINVRAGTYTREGYILPRWIGPSTKGNTDWIGLYKVGTPDDAPLSLQYVGKGTRALANQIRIPASLSTADRYEVRYLRRNIHEVAARSSAFSIKATPTLACASAYFANSELVPSAHYVSLGQTSGKVTFSFNHYGGIKDRVVVWSDDAIVYDSGCTATSATVTLNYTNPNSRLLVTAYPTCDVVDNDAWSDLDWSMSCPQ